MESAAQLQEFLLAEWSTGLRLTTIPQAMQHLKIEDDQGLRWRVASDLEKSWRDTLTSSEKRRGIAEALGRVLDEARDDRWQEQVGTWNLASILLTEQEKLVARAILMYRRKAQGTLPPRVIVQALGLKSTEVNQAIRMLARIGFLSLLDRRLPGSYTFTDGHEQFLEGLGFSFHTVTLDTGEHFGVPWAVDFLLLVGSQYKEHFVTLDDSCAHCVDRIHVEVDRGNLVQVDPEESVVYRGGTWGQNNLFRSEEHLRDFQASVPESHQWMLVSQFLTNPDTMLEANW